MALFGRRILEQYPVAPSLLLTVGSVLLAAELFCLQLCLRAYCLQFELLTYNSSSLFPIELLCLQWDSVSKKHLNGL